MAQAAAGLDAASLEVRRSGPLVAIVSGDAIPEESHKLLATVHYDSQIISVPQPTVSEVAKTGQLLLGIVTLVIVGQRGDPAGAVSGWRPGAVPHRTRQAGLVRLRGGVHSSGLAGEWVEAARRGEGPASEGLMGRSKPVEK